MSLTRTTLCIFALFAGVATAEDGEWGHLDGRFTLAGEAPPVNELPIAKDVAEFGKSIIDESLMVNEKNQGIANVVIYLLPDDDATLHIHPSYAETQHAKVNLSMDQGRFVPRIVLLRTTQTLTERNKDAVAHNARIDFIQNVPK